MARRKCSNFRVFHFSQRFVQSDGISRVLSPGLLKLGSVAVHFRVAIDKINSRIYTHLYKNTCTFAKLYSRSNRFRENVLSFDRNITSPSRHRKRGQSSKCTSLSILFPLSFSLCSVIRSVGFACETPPRVTELGWQI